MITVLSMSEYEEVKRDLEDKGLNYTVTNNSDYSGVEITFTIL